MKKFAAITLTALLLTSCGTPSDVVTQREQDAATSTTTARATMNLSSEPTTTAAEKSPYIEGYYDVNYTLKKIHRSGCDKLLTASDQEFEIMIKNILHDWIDKKHFSTCGYCDPEIPRSETADVDLPQLYIDFFSPYAYNVGEIAPGAIQQKLLKHPEYTFEHIDSSGTALQSYTIHAENGDYIYMVFYPRYTGDVVEGLSTLAYHRDGKEISISDDTHISKPKYTTFDESRDPKKAAVTDIGELEIFMFAVTE